MKEIYDRDSERIKIVDFLNSFNNFMLLEGPSGSGKSTLIHYMLEQHLKENEVLQFSLKDNKFSSLEEFFLQTYQKHRKINIIQKIKDKALPNIAITIGGIVAIGFGQKDNSIVVINDDFLEQYLRILDKDNIKILYISNLELANKKEQEILYKLIETRAVFVKVILEIGTLNNDKEILKKIKSKVSNQIKISHFDSKNTKNLYEFIYNKSAPSSLYAKTDGNSFAIVHFNADNTLVHNIEEIIKNKMDSLEKDLVAFLLYLYLFNGQININLFKKFIALTKIDFTLTCFQLESKEIIVIKNQNIQFKHVFFNRYFEQRPQELLKEYQFKIYTFFKKEYKQDNSNNSFLSLELAKLSLKLGLIDDFKEYSWESLSTSYNQQNYYISLQVAEFLLANKDKINEKTYIWVQFIYIQTSLLLGNGYNLLTIIEKSLDLFEKYFEQNQINLIISLIYYHQNNFKESIAIVQKLIIDLTEKKSHYLPLALSIQVSNYIAEGKVNKSKDYYTDAFRLFEEYDKESLFELKRLAPRIEGFILGQTILEDIIKNKYIKQYPYLEKKCLHNLAICFLMQGKLDKAKEHFYESYVFFEQNQSPEITYTLNGIALYEIANNNFQKAEEILLDALNLCHEQYDKSTVYNNLGAISMLNGNFNDAYKFCKKAEDALNIGISPLTDPVIRHRIYHNLWLISYELQHSQEVKTYQELAKPPSCLYFKKSRIEKYNVILNEIQQEKQINHYTRMDNDSIEWSVRNFKCSFSKLSFYDFNFKVVKNVPKKI